MFTSYQELYMNSDNMDYIVSKRLEMIRYTTENGIKKAAKFYSCSKNTIKKWYRRYQTKGMDGLKDISRKPHNSPNKIKQEDAELITSTVKSAKEKKKYITVNNIRKATDISDYSDATINRHINKSLGKIRNTKKPDTKNKSTEWKKDLKPFEFIQVDIKYLTDIDNLKPYFNDRNLMKYQITARDVCTGFPIVAYCMEKSVTYTKMFLEEILHPFLTQFPYLDLKDIVIQTDNGNEFYNPYQKTKGQTPKESTFRIYVNEKFKKHINIIPGHCTAQSDVETFHWSIERDCLAWDDIVDNDTLIKYTTEYINKYIKTEIKTRGYSPLDKIKTALDVTEITIPKPQLLTV